MKKKHVRKFTEITHQKVDLELKLPKNMSLTVTNKSTSQVMLEKYLCYFHPSFGEEFHFVRILFYNWVETNAYKSYFNEIFCSRWMRSTSTSLGKQVVGPPIAVFRVVSLRLKFNNMRLR